MLPCEQNKMVVHDYVMGILLIQTLGTTVAYCTGLLSLSWCFTSTETIWLKMIRDEGRLRRGMRARLTSLFTQLLNSGE